LTLTVDQKIAVSSALACARPQPTSNKNLTQNQKRLFLHLALEEEVVGLAILLLLI
jgi:hypothetical protein